jgi:predicted NUDIX family NTP pyrophosphohydrolase
MNSISVLIQHHCGPTGDVLIYKNANGVWEFPNGVQRTGETPEAAVSRIAMETVGMVVTPGKLTMLGHKRPQDGKTEHLVVGNITHNSNTKCDYHSYYEAINTWQTEPVSAEAREYKWVHPSELGEYTFAGDDENFMAKYDPWVNAREIPDRRMY